MEQHNFNDLILDLLKFTINSYKVKISRSKCFLFRETCTKRLGLSPLISLRTNDNVTVKLLPLIISASWRVLVYFLNHKSNNCKYLNFNTYPFEIILNTIIYFLISFLFCDFCGINLIEIVSLKLKSNFKIFHFIFCRV